MLGIIGGTGLTALDNLNISKRLIVRTPYGEPSQPLVFGEINGKKSCFWRVMVAVIPFHRMR